MSTATTTLKLVTPDTTAADTIPFDRRTILRRAISGRVTALQGDFHGSHKICSLQMINLSEKGLGAMTEESIEIDCPITIFFPPHGPERGFDKEGRIVRCIEQNGRHEIGIEFSRRAAA